MGSSRVIIHKSHGEVSLVEQDIIKYVSYLFKIQNQIFKYLQLHFMQLLSADATTFWMNWKEKIAPANMKKQSSKVAHNRPETIFFSIDNQPKTSPNHNFCSIKIADGATYV